MNIVFEGISGSGKSTIVKEFLEKLDKKNIEYHHLPDIHADTPLKPVLANMNSDSTLLQMKKRFKTSLFESLVLAGNHHYMQEQHRNKPLSIYDRDFISVLSFQKDIIKAEYPHNWQDFYSAFREIMLFELKEIDDIIYVSTPVETCNERVEKRDKRKLTTSEQLMIYSLKKNMEREIADYCKDNDKTSLLVLDGTKPPKQNVELIFNHLGHKLENIKNNNEEMER